MKKHLLIIWTIFIFLLLTIPMPPNTGDVLIEGQLDKVAHFFMFGIFSYLLIGSIVDRTNYTFLLSVLAGIFYSALGEYIQSFLPSRTVSLYDFYAGAVGAFLFVIYYYVRTRKKA